MKPFVDADCVTHMSNSAIYKDNGNEWEYSSVLLFLRFHGKSSKKEKYVKLLGSDFEQCYMLETW